jgi:hypothetical protein
MTSGRGAKEALMTAYTFYLHENAEAVPSFEIAYFDAIDPALDYGKRLLKDRPRYNFVEIAHGDDNVGKVMRDAL